MPHDTRLLAGVRVLDLSIWRPGPYATSLLVALGADTLKVEPPGGDPMRHYAGLFETINSGKRSLELDLKDQGDRGRAMELACEADVVVEGFRPGVMARLGLDDATVRARNPGVVYCSISGYGQDDPRAALPGHDVNYQAWAAALTPDAGAVATIPPLPVADLAAGMAAAFGVCAALLGRAASGRGTYLDVSMTDVLSTWTGRAGAGGSGDPTTVPGYGLFTTADGGQLSLGVLNEQHFWSALCKVLEPGGGPRLRRAQPAWNGDAGRGARCHHREEAGRAGLGAGRRRRTRGAGAHPHRDALGNALSRLPHPHPGARPTAGGPGPRRAPRPGIPPAPLTPAASAGCYVAGGP